MKKKIVIFGSGGHSKVVIDILESTKQFSIVGLIDSYRPKDSFVYGYRILGDEFVIKGFYDEIDGGIVAIGDNFIRSKVVDKILGIFPNFKFLSAIHPYSVIGKEVEVEEGTVVMAGSIINSNTSIGKHCIINTKSSIDHDVVIGNFATIAPGATLGGNVRLGDYSVVSVGANVINSKIIENHVVIGAGATVLSDINSYVVAYGTPARIMRTREAGEKYL